MNNAREIRIEIHLTTNGGSDLTHHVYGDISIW